MFAFDYRLSPMTEARESIDLAYAQRFVRIAVIGNVGFLLQGETLYVRLINGKRDQRRAL